MQLFCIFVPFEKLDPFPNISWHHIFLFLPHFVPNKNGISFWKSTSLLFFKITKKPVDNSQEFIQGSRNVLVFSKDFEQFKIVNTT